MANELGNLYRNFDENDKVLPYGQEGRIVITLYNKAHPLLDMTLVISGFWMKKYLAKTYFKKLIEGPMMLWYYPAGKTAGLTFYYHEKHH
jgi:phenylacetate-CoA ligase